MNIYAFEINKIGMDETLLVEGKKENIEKRKYNKKSILLNKTNMYKYVYNIENVVIWEFGR